jgi:EAL domain-containing protein (putative c-di-GMP-specific phosphodiesterase class I)
VVAEAVENQLALEAMREHGVTLGQGFLLGRPIAPADFAAALATPADRGPGRRSPKATSGMP